MNAKIIVLPKSNKAVIAVGKTGFRSTLRHNRGTRFNNETDARAFASHAGIFNFVILPATNATHIPAARKAKSASWCSNHQSEHAALVAVVEAAKRTSGNAHAAGSLAWDDTLLKLRQSLANLAAVREGGVK